MLPHPYQNESEMQTSNIYNIMEVSNRDQECEMPRSDPSPYNTYDEGPDQRILNLSMMSDCLILNQLNQERNAINQTQEQNNNSVMMNENIDFEENVLQSNNEQTQRLDTNLGNQENEVQGIATCDRTSKNDQHDHEETTTEQPETTDGSPRDCAPAEEQNQVSKCDQCREHFMNDEHETHMIHLCINHDGWEPVPFISQQFPDPQKVNRFNYINIHMANTYVLALIDSGASVSTIHKDILGRVPKEDRSEPDETRNKTARYVMGITGKLEPISNVCKVRFHIDGNEHTGLFHEISSCFKVLLGMDFLSQNKAKYDFNQGTLYLNDHIYPLRTLTSEAYIARSIQTVSIRADTVQEIDIVMTGHNGRDETFLIEPLECFKTKYPDLVMLSLITDTNISRARIVNDTPHTTVITENQDVGIARRSNAEEVLPINDLSELQKDADNPEGEHEPHSSNSERGATGPVEDGPWKQKFTKIFSVFLQEEPQTEQGLAETIERTDEQDRFRQLIDTLSASIEGIIKQTFELMAEENIDSSREAEERRAEVSNKHFHTYRNVLLQLLKRAYRCHMPNTKCLTNTHDPSDTPVSKTDHWCLLCCTECCIMFDVCRPNEDRAFILQWRHIMGVNYDLLFKNKQSSVDTATACVQSMKDYYSKRACSIDTSSDTSKISYAIPRGIMNEQVTDTVTGELATVADLTRITEDEDTAHTRKHYCPTNGRDNTCAHLCYLFDLCRNRETRPEVKMLRVYIDGVRRGALPFEHRIFTSLIGNLEPVHNIAKETMGNESHWMYTEDVHTLSEEIVTGPNENRLAGIALDIGEDDLPEEDRTKFRNFLEEHHLAFATGKHNMGRLKDYEYEIKLKPDATNVCSRAYPVHPNIQQLLDDELDQQMKFGIIEESDSVFGSPVVIVKKKDGSIRPCVDFRKLNKQVQPEYWPLLNFKDIMTFVAHEKPKFFCTLDFISGYHQIAVHPNSRDILSAATPRRVFKFKCLPFGFINSGPAFTKKLHNVIGSVVNKNHACLFVDDLIVCSQTVDEMIRNLRPILEALIENQLTLHGLKGAYLKRKSLFVGHQFTIHGIQVNEQKTKAVSSFPRPSNVKQTRSFLGLTSYFRAFIKGYAELAKPLHHLTKLKVPFVWTDEQETAFEALKQQLVSPPTLIYPDETKTFHLATDASGHTLGYVLYQKCAPVKDEQGKTTKREKMIGIIAYGARSFNDREKNYTIHVKELLAVITAFRNFHAHLIHSKTIVHCDRSSIVTLSNGGAIKNINHNSSMIQRYLLELSNYNYQMVHITTDKNPADALTRLSNLSTEEPETKETPFQDFYEVDTVMDQPTAGPSTEDQQTTQQLMEIEDVDRYLTEQEELQIGMEQESDSESETDTEGDYSNDRSDESSDGYMSSLEEQTTDRPDSKDEQVHDTLPFLHMKEQASEIPREKKFFEYSFMATTEPEREPGDTSHTVSSLENIDMAKLQQECPTIRDIYEMKKSGVVRESEFLTQELIKNADHFTLQGDTLMHMVRNKMSDRSPATQIGSHTWRIVIPKCLRKQVLREFHDDIGHQGFQRTMEKIKQKFYWPFCYRDVETYLRSCIICQKASKHMPRPSTLNSLPVGEPDSYVNYRAALDLCGPYVKSRENYVYILSYMEHATCYSFYIPLKDMRAETIAHALHNQVFTVIGPPELLLSDLGQNLISEIIKTLSQLWSITRIRCAARKPSTNGSLERSHSVLNQVIKKFVLDHHTDWPIHLPMVNYALRSAISAHHGTSAMFALFGFEPRSFLERNIDIGLSNAAISRGNITQFVQSMKHARQVQYEYILKTQERNKKQHDKKAKDRTFEVGDIVLVHNPTTMTDQSRKILPMWRGPMEITYRSVSGRYYKLRSTSTGKVSKATTGVQRLKRCYLPTECRVRQSLSNAERTDLPRRRIEDRIPGPSMPTRERNTDQDMSTVAEESSDKSDNESSSAEEQSENGGTGNENTSSEEDANDQQERNGQPTTSSHQKATQQNNGTSQALEQGEQKIPVSHIKRLVNIVITKNSTRYKILLKNAAHAKWFKKEQVDKLPLRMVEEVLTRRTKKGLPRKMSKEARARATRAKILNKANHIQQTHHTSPAE